MDKDKRAKLAQLRQDKADKKTALELQRHTELLNAVNSLHSLIKHETQSGIESTDKLIAKLSEFNVFKNEVNKVYTAIQSIPTVDSVSITNLSELIDAQQDFDTTDVVDAIQELVKVVENNSERAVKITNQSVMDYIPTRRVRKIGDRLVFDDDPMKVEVVTAGGGGGGSSSSVQQALIRDTDDGKAIAIVNPDGSAIGSGGGGGGGDASAAKQDQQTALLQQILNAIDVNVYNEVPSGAINDTNKDFTTFYDYKPATIRVYLNGLRQKESSDYIETGDDSIQFINAPQTGDSVIIDYIRQ